MSKYRKIFTSAITFYRSAIKGSVSIPDTAKKRAILRNLMLDTDETLKGHRIDSIIYNTIKGKKIENIVFYFETITYDKIKDLTIDELFDVEKPIEKYFSLEARNGSDIGEFFNEFIGYILGVMKIDPKMIPKTENANLAMEKFINEIKEIFNPVQNPRSLSKLLFLIFVLIFLVWILVNIIQVVIAYAIGCLVALIVLIYKRLVKKEKFTMSQVFKYIFQSWLYVLDPVIKTLRLKNVM
jgi:hypothetical protein